jgi:DNA-binding MarR family transcriptional regulator
MDVEKAPQRLRALPSWLLAQMAHEARAAVSPVLARHGLHRSQYALLASLEEFGPSSQAELGERTGLDRSDVVRWLDDLATRGLVAREQDPADRRRNVISVTDRGRRTLITVGRDLENAQDHVLKRLLPRERKDLIRLLRRGLGA